MNNQRLKIAIQKNGRLTAKSFDYLKSLGLMFDTTNSELITSCLNSPIDILLVRNSDICDLVSSGVVDFGITGKNMVIETGKNTSVATELNFARCSVIIATPKNSSIKSLNDLQNKIIATSYPNTLKNYLNKVGIKSNIIIMNGSVEIAPKLGLADAICDITETGSSLKKNDLEIIETIFKSEACLIESKSFNPKKEILLNILTSKYENISI